MLRVPARSGFVPIHASGVRRARSWQQSASQPSALQRFVGKSVQATSFLVKAPLGRRFKSFIAKVDFELNRLISAVSV